MSKIFSKKIILFSKIKKYFRKKVISKIVSKWTCKKGVGRRTFSQKAKQEISCFSKGKKHVFSEKSHIAKIPFVFGFKFAKFQR